MCKNNKKKNFKLEYTHVPLCCPLRSEGRKYTEVGSRKSFLGFRIRSVTIFKNVWPSFSICNYIKVTEAER